VQPSSHSTQINGLAVAGDAVGEIHARHVVARTAPDEVRFAVFGLNEIVSGAAEDQVAAPAAVEFVVATQAPDTIFSAGAVQPFTPSLPRSALAPPPRTDSASAFPAAGVRKHTLITTSRNLASPDLFSKRCVLAG
jgi:hypothetical protein